MKRSQLFTSLALTAILALAVPAAAQHRGGGGSRGGSSGGGARSSGGGVAAPRSGGSGSVRGGGSVAAPRSYGTGGTYGGSRYGGGSRYYGGGSHYYGGGSRYYGGYYGGGSRYYGGYYGGYRYVAPIHFYRPYYAFHSNYSLGFGLYVGYPFAYAYPFYDPYYYGYPGYPAAVYGAPYYGAPYPAAAPGYSVAPEVNINRDATTATAGPSQSNMGGLSFEITPSTAEIFIDGNRDGTVGQFTPSTQPLGVPSGRHHVEIRAQGYHTMSFDVDVVSGQVIPYQGTMER